MTKEKQTKLLLNCLIDTSLKHDRCAAENTELQWTGLNRNTNVLETIQTNCITNKLNFPLMICY